MQRIEGLIYGEDPKQGFLENNIFYHPELKFQFPIPANWNYQNTPQRVQLAPKDGKALLMMTLAPGNNLQEAASTMLQQNGLRALESQQITVNGLPAIAIVAEPQPQQQQPGQQQQQQQQPSVRILTYLIEHNKNIYWLLGATSAMDFNQYYPVFKNTMEGFRTLTDQAKINKKSERIRNKSVSKSATLQQVLKNYKTPDDRLNELAILNGMNLTDMVPVGMMIKTIGN